MLNTSLTKRSLCVSVHALALCAALLGSPARAETGVSEQRVVLPDGPGSLGGMGENAQVDLNMGLMRYAVPIEVPEGYTEITPDLELTYSSGNGSSPLGIGWEMPVPSIERMSLRGLPEYTSEDEFSADGGTELVRVSVQGSVATYRARKEGAFVRYKWYQGSTNGKGGYWTAEYPNGTIGYFGADELGKRDESANVVTPAGATFRYHLVALLDLFGHRTLYRYVQSEGYALLSGIDYVETSTGPRFSMRFEYGSRPDIVSSCVPGFDLRLTKRLSRIRVLSLAQQIRTYTLSYEDEATAGGFSRLRRVTQVGLDEAQLPIVFSFGYSRALEGSCSGCEQPFMVDMGTLAGGVDLKTGRSTLLDINGDALPDVLQSTDDGRHTFYLSELTGSGQPSFDGKVVTSQHTEKGSSFVLGTPAVQVLDVNGDGFTDIISSRTGEVLCNTGVGDWGGTTCISDTTLPSMDEDGNDDGDGNPLHVRFLDYDDDKRIDMIRTLVGQTEVFHNTGSAFTSLAVDDIGAQFDEGTLELADINGDGLLDPTQLLLGGTLRYRLNFGFGRWSDWTQVTVEGLDDAAFLNAQIEDLNGDGLADVVVVNGSTVSVALNRNGARFESFRTFDSQDVKGDIPERIDSTSVLFADMNGTGSTDIVWITSSGHARFLELFPVKPNLLSRIENGVGSVQTVAYGASVQELGRDLMSAPWKHRVPHSMNVVVATDHWVTLTGDEDGKGLHEVTEYRYHDGFYDGKEKSFRGYGRVEEALLADENLDSQEGALTEETFDLGASDPYLSGLLLRSRTMTADGSPISEERHEYGDCALAEVPTKGLRLPVRHVCKLASEEILQEGLQPSEWVTKREEHSYDGHGQVIREANLGVVHEGPPEAPKACAACERDTTLFGAPCGKKCTGDEQYVETTYVAPGDATGGAWMLGREVVERSYGKAGDITSETRTRYDGPAFEGLAEGQLRRGLVSLVRERRGSSGADFIALSRNAYDSHGNLIETLDPNGAPAVTDGHRRRFEYDKLGLNLTRAEVLLADDDGPYALRRDVSYESTFNGPSEATDWMLVRAGKVASARDSTRYRYDEFGRTAAILLPGDSDATPSQVFAYELAAPVSRIVIRGRSTLGGALDLEEVECIDGAGRQIQTRTRIAEDAYQVSGFNIYNRRGAAVRMYQPYRREGAACETIPPGKVLFTALRYDAIGRHVETVLPDKALYGKASLLRTQYRPLSAWQYDAEDTDSSSPHADTPWVEERDGLERLVALRRYLTADKSSADSTLLRYDGLGRLTEIEANGQVKKQRFDLLGRILEVRDPNAGLTRFLHDDAGNLVRREDARTEATVMKYDGANRLIARYDQKHPKETRVSYHYDTAQDCSACKNLEGELARVEYPLGGTLGSGSDAFGYSTRGDTTYNERRLLGHSFPLRHRHDNASRLLETTYPDGSRITRTYDAASRLVAIPGVLDRISYEERGLARQITYADKTSTTLIHDDLMRLARRDTTSATGAVLQAYAYERDRADNLREIQDDTEAAGNATYKYDAWYRSNGAVLGSGEQREKLSFDFDASENITQLSSSLGATSAAHVGPYGYSPDRPNALSKAGGRSYKYDAAGSLITRGDTELAWDYQGRLRSAKGGHLEGSFAYGAGEERVLKSEGDSLTYFIAPDFEVRDGIATLYARVGAERVARLESDAIAPKLLPDLAPQDAPDGKIRAADAWLAVSEKRDDATVGHILQSSARRLLLDTGADLTLLHSDHLGSAELATAGGEIVGRQRFYPTGELRASEGYVDAYGFTGQERDESTGLTHFRFRSLDSSVGRWVSPDPLFETLSPDSVQRLGEATTGYAYVGNAFENGVDPTGLVNAKRSEKSKAYAKVRKRKFNGTTYKLRSKMKVTGILRSVGVHTGSDTNSTVRTAVNAITAKIPVLIKSQLTYTDSTGVQKTRSILVSNPAYGKEPWDAGHAIGQQNGGSGTAILNIFPQNKEANRWKSRGAAYTLVAHFDKHKVGKRSWRDFEDKIKRKTAKYGKVVQKVSLYYE